MIEMTKLNLFFEYNQFFHARFVSLSKRPIDDDSSQILTRQSKRQMKATNSGQSRRLIKTGKCRAANQKLSFI